VGATATVVALRGIVTAVIANFNARAANGQNYQVFAAATPRVINPSTLAQDGRSTGKLCFDVVGAPPNSVVYNAGGQDLLID
jgi:Domain of unknown function (DUF1942)